MRSQIQTMNAKTWLLVIVLAVIWGGSFFFFKILLVELPPLTIVTARVMIASLALLAYLRLSGQSLPKGPRVWRAFFTLALMNNVVPFTLIVWSEIHITSGLAAVLNATVPVFSVILAHFFANEPLRPNRVAGILLSLLGVVILIGPSALRGFNLTNLAQLAVLFAAFLYSCAALYAQRFKAMQISPVAVLAGQLIAASVITLPLGLVVDRPWTFGHAPSLVTWSALLGLASLSTAVAYVMYFRILAVAGATNSVLVTFLIPLSALLLGTLVLKERLAALDFGGILVIFVGLVILDGRIFQMLRRHGKEPQPIASA